MSDEWFIERSQQVAGPFTSQQLKELAASGRLTSVDGIRKGPVGAFVAASKARGLFEGETKVDRPDAPPVYLSAAEPKGGAAIRRGGASLLVLARSLTTEIATRTKSGIGHLAMTGLGVGCLYGMVFGGLIFNGICGALLGAAVYYAAHRWPLALGVSQSTAQVCGVICCSLFAIGLVWQSSEPPRNKDMGRVVSGLTPRLAAIPDATHRDLLAALETHDPNKVAPIVSKCNALQLFTSSELAAMNRPYYARDAMEGMCTDSRNRTYRLPRPVAFLSLTSFNDRIKLLTGTFYEVRSRTPSCFGGSSGLRISALYAVETKDVWFAEAERSRFRIVSIVFKGGEGYSHEVNDIREDGSYSITCMKRGKSYMRSQQQASMENQLYEAWGRSMRVRAGEWVYPEDKLYRIQVKRDQTFQVDLNP